MADRDDPVPDPASERPGIPQFTAKDLHELMENELSEGSCGTVYSLRGFPGLAVKEIRIDGQNSNVTRAIGFEIAVLIKLSHPNIIKYHQVIEDGDFIYIIMDQYNGNLEHFLTKHKRKRIQVPTELIYSILEQIISALAYLHGVQGVDANEDPYQGIVHRDLKPDNVLVSEDGSRVVLADFGLCRSAMTSGTTRAGSPAYMAPETLLYNSTSPASDIWALGVIIYELATLKRLDFLGDKEPRHVFIDGWKPDLSAIEDDSVRNILERIFVLDPEERPTARSLQELLNPSISSMGMLRLRVASLEEVLGAAGARTGALEEAVAALKDRIDAQSIEISTLRRDLAIKSSTIDSLKQQFTKAIEDLKQQLAEDAISLRPQTPSTITGHTILSALDSSWTPLMCAAVAGDIETAKRHLSDKDEKNSDGDTAYTLAAKAGQGAISELLDPTDEKGVTALMRAAERGDVEAVEALTSLQKERQTSRAVNINGWLIFKETALMRAAACGHAEVIKLLVDHERGLKDGIGRTALIFAAKSGHAECVELLLEKEADMQDNQSWTALMWAVYNNKLECAKLLLEKEACMQARNGMTALMVAGRNSHTECVKLLLEKESGMQNSDGWTALMLTVFWNKIECVKLLAEKEKDMKTTHEWNGYPPSTTALDIAKKERYTKIASLLRK